MEGAIRTCGGGGGNGNGDDGTGDDGNFIKGGLDRRDTGVLSDGGGITSGGRSGIKMVGAINGMLFGDDETDGLRGFKSAELNESMLLHERGASGPSSISSTWISSS